MKEHYHNRVQQMPTNPEIRPQTEEEAALGIVPGTTLEEYMNGVGVAAHDSYISRVKKMPANPENRPPTAEERALRIAPGTTAEEYMNDIGVAPPPPRSS